MPMRDDDTLWTKRGELPEDLARLEADLASLDLPPEPDWDAVPVPVRVPVWRRPVARAYAWATAAVLAVAAIAGQWLVRDAWHVEALAGSPSVGGLAIGQRLAMGSALACDESSKARLLVGGLGRVDLEPGSVLRRVPGGRGERRLALDHGTLHASISAPPRLFIVETKSGVATDLGCAYTLSVDREGQGRLAVTSGRVVLGRADRESFVPAGAWCPITPAGAGLPRRDYASAAFLEALAMYDQPNCAATVLDTVLERAEASDALTLWHLLPRVQGTNRERVARRIAALIEVPAEVAIERVLALEPAALDAWWAAIGMGPAVDWRATRSKKDLRL
jgi:hypothetical protein